MGIILLIVVAGLAVWLLTQHSETGARTHTAATAPAETALELLRKRYARGEISRDEFETRRRDLV